MNVHEIRACRCAPVRPVAMLPRLSPLGSSLLLCGQHHWLPWGMVKELGPGLEHGMHERLGDRVLLVCWLHTAVITRSVYTGDPLMTPPTAHPLVHSLPRWVQANPGQHYTVWLCSHHHHHHRSCLGDWQGAFRVCCLASSFAASPTAHLPAAAWCHAADLSVTQCRTGPVMPQRHNDQVVWKVPPAQ